MGWDLDLAAVRRVVELARVGVGEEELERVLEEVRGLVGYVARLRELEAAAESRNPALDGNGAMDKAPAGNESALADEALEGGFFENAPATLEGMLAVPPVMVDDRGGGDWEPETAGRWLPEEAAPAVLASLRRRLGGEAVAEGGDEEGVLGWSGRRIGAMVRSREVSAEEVVTAFLARIEEVEPRVGAWLEVRGEEALEAARRVDHRIGRGEDPGPLAGAPFAVKDNLARRGWAMTGASRILEGYVSPYTATAVERLEAAGAIPLGRANLDELGMGAGTEHSAFQVTRNPWALARVPGGSSGGPRRRWRRGWRVSPWGRIRGGRCASRRRSAAWWG